MKMIHEKSVDRATLDEYVQKLVPGISKSWTDVFSETGVVMDPSGKSKLRQALNAIGLEKHTVHGSGFRIVDSGSAMEYIEGLGSKDFRMLRNSHRKVTNVAVHRDQLDEGDRRNFDATTAMYGALIGHNAHLKLLRDRRKLKSIPTN